MLNRNTPVEDHREAFGLWVKREDLACPPPGPPFSKARGVYAWVAKQEAEVIGVLDTYHSQAGHAVARACSLLGKKCVNYYPSRVKEKGPFPAQLKSAELGAEIVALKAGMSAVLYHQAKKDVLGRGGVMIPNALKLSESVDETAKEVTGCPYADYVIVPASSGTIAAGVIRGFVDRANDIGRSPPKFIIHLGYSRSHEELLQYLADSSGYSMDDDLTIIDEGYSYGDESRPGRDPAWPSNKYYDLKAFRWLINHRSEYAGEMLMWNVG